MDVRGRMFGSVGYERMTRWLKERKYMPRPITMFALWLALMSAIAFAAPTPTPLTYSTTFTDPSGTPQSVSFTGTASGTSLTGTLTANGAAVQVTATIGSDG